MLGASSWLSQFFLLSSIGLGAFLLNLIGSEEYLQAALAISHSNYFAVDNGFRPPLFPLLLASAGENLHVMFAIRLAIGIVVSVLLFEIFNLITGRPLIYEAVFSSLGNPEDNNRYKVPVESLIFGIAILLIYLLPRNFWQRRGKEASGADLQP